MQDHDTITRERLLATGWQQIEHIRRAYRIDVGTGNCPTSIILTKPNDTWHIWHATAPCTLVVRTMADVRFYIETTKTTKVKNRFEYFGKHNVPNP